MDIASGNIPIAYDHFAVIKYFSDSEVLERKRALEQSNGLLEPSSLVQAESALIGVYSTFIQAEGILNALDLTKGQIGEVRSSNISGTCTRDSLLFRVGC